MNGDQSGLTTEESIEVSRFWRYVGPEAIIADVGEPYYGHPEIEGLPGTVADYTVLYPEEPRIIRASDSPSCFQGGL